MIVLMQYITSMMYKNKRCFACVHQYIGVIQRIIFGLPVVNYLSFSGMFALNTNQRPLMILITSLPKISFLLLKQATRKY